MRAILPSIIGWLMLAAGALAGPVNVDGSGLALEGHDPVAYFTQSQAVPGDPAITADHDGATYRFATLENKAAFEASPGWYLPQYGGFCAFGMASGYQAPVEPDQFTVADGKLYLNYNASVKSRWQKDVPDYVSQADVNWLKQ